MDRPDAMHTAAKDIVNGECCRDRPTRREMRGRFLERALRFRYSQSRPLSSDEGAVAPWINLRPSWHRPDPTRGKSPRRWHFLKKSSSMDCGTDSSTAP